MCGRCIRTIIGFGAGLLFSSGVIASELPSERLTYANCLDLYRAAKIIDSGGFLSALGEAVLSQSLSPERNATVYVARLDEGTVPGHVSSSVVIAIEDESITLNFKCRPGKSEHNLGEVRKFIETHTDGKLAALSGVSQGGDRRTLEEFAKQLEEALGNRPKTLNLSKEEEQSLVGLIRSQIEKCWSKPAGVGRGIEPFALNVDFDREGRVKAVSVVDQQRLFTDLRFRSVAESAIRAVKNPRCSPILLPPEQFEAWRRTTIVFDPSQ